MIALILKKQPFPKNLLGLMVTAVTLSLTLYILVDAPANVNLFPILNNNSKHLGPRYILDKLAVMCICVTCICKRKEEIC